MLVPSDPSLSQRPFKSARRSRSTSEFVFSGKHFAWQFTCQERSPYTSSSQMLSGVGFGEVSNAARTYHARVLKYTIVRAPKASRKRRATSSAFSFVPHVTVFELGFMLPSPTRTPSRYARSSPISHPGCVHGSDHASKSMDRGSV